MAMAAAPTLPVRIAGVGRHLPKRVVSSQEIEAKTGAPAGWVEKHTGVAERRWAERSETPSKMGAKAAREAIASAGLKLGDIDLVINASFTPVMSLPDSSVFLVRELGLQGTGVRSFSIHATCLSFLVGLETAASLIANGRHENVLIVSSETPSIGINFDEPESAALFGDMAAAAVLTPRRKGQTGAVNGSLFETFSEGAEMCVIRGGGHYRHPNDPETTPEDNLFHMNGPQVFRLAHRRLPSFMDRLFEGSGASLSDMQWVVPHQASLFALASVGRACGIPDEQMVITVGKFGNCVAASIPGTLYEAVNDGRIQRGDSVLLLGTGAGFAMGAVMIEY